LLIELGPSTEDLGAALVGAVTVVDRVRRGRRHQERDQVAGDRATRVSQHHDGADRGRQHRGERFQRVGRQVVVERALEMHLAAQVLEGPG